MADNAQSPSQLDKLFGTLRFAVIAFLIGGAVYFFGPALFQQAKNSSNSNNKTDPEEARRLADLRKKEEEEAKDKECRKKISTDAYGRIQDRGQEIVNAAFPNAIRAAPFQNCKLDGVSKIDDGYQAIVTIYYTNIFNDQNHMEILLKYDSVAGYRGYKIGKCNDRWATPGQRISVLDLVK